MKLHKILLTAMALCFFAAPHHLAAQSEVNMANGDTIVLDACTLGSGIIYDNGGPTLNYSNYFNGWVLIESTPGVMVTLSGAYTTETCCDFIDIWDGGTLIGNHVAGTGSLYVTAHSGQLLIYFHSDGSMVYGGFALNWSTNSIPGSCTSSVMTVDTANVTENSVDLSWTATDATGPFIVYFNGDSVAGITGTSYTLTGLSPSTRYEVTVVPASLAGNYCCGSYTTFRTDCGQVLMPYEEDFEDYAEGDFPYCWQMSVNFDESAFIPQIDAAHHSSGYRSMMLSCGGNSTAGHYGMLMTPPLLSNGQYRVQFSMMSSHSNTRVVIGHCNENGTNYDNYGFVPTDTFTVGTSWMSYAVTLNVASGRRMAFRMLQSMQNSAGRYVYIDGMAVESCGVETVQVSHVESTQLDLSWVTFGNPTCSVGIRPDGWTTDSVTIPNAVSPVSITDLAPGRQYTFTVYPTCGSSSSIGRGVTVITPPLPISADNYCTSFAGSGALPANWTFHTTGVYTFTPQSTGITWSTSYPSNGENNFMVSERFTDLAGKQVAIRYTSDNGVTMMLGTMEYADDVTTFVPIQTLTTTYDEGHDHTVVFTVPNTSTGNYLAIGLRMFSYYYQVTINAIEIRDSCMMGHARMVHRRGTSVQLAWDVTYDTVLVQYGVNDFAIGNGQVDTFYNASRGTIRGLMQGTAYDFYVYRPCGQPCSDRQIEVNTAWQDYPLPYCEDFTTLSEDRMWSYSNYGDWQKLYTLNNTPRRTPYYYDNNVDGALEFASWGPNYYGTALLPDVEVDSHTVLSFYIHDNSPHSVIVIGTVPEGYSNNYFITLDTIHVVAQGERRHYSYSFRPSDTLFDARVAIRYYHINEFEFYRCQIDELQFTHGAYGTLERVYLSHDSVSFNLTSVQGADSVEITLVSGYGSHILTIDTSQIHSFGMGELRTGTSYRCYVRTIPGGCMSYAGTFVTHSNGGGDEGGSGDIVYNDCFTMDDVLSYELPFHWAASGNTTVTTEDYLELAPAVSVAMHPMLNVAGKTFSFRSKGMAEGDTLLVGYLPADSISTDSVHFLYTEADCSFFDTIILDTIWQGYYKRLPSSGTGRQRICFVALNDTVGIDNIGLTNCPIVNFSVDGNVIVATVDDNMYSGYHLTIDDSLGTVHRVLFIDESPFRIEGLKLGTRYAMSWRCSYSEPDCQPVVYVTTDNRIPLPYCIDFTDADNAFIPTTWTYHKNNPSATLRINTSPALELNSTNSSQWSYMVLPAVASDSVWTAFLRFYCGPNTQVGMMNNENNTASFVPLFTATNTSYSTYNVPLELNGYVGKHLAIRTRNMVELYSLHMYGIPLVSYKLIHSNVLRLCASSNYPYWFKARNYAIGDTLIYVTDSVYDFHFGGGTWLYVSPAVDSTGYYCENETYLETGSAMTKPYCWLAGWSGNNWLRTYNGTGSYSYNGNTYYRLYQDTWVLLQELAVDSLQEVGMNVVYRAPSPTEELVVGVLTDVYDTTTFIPVDTLVYTRTDDKDQIEYVDFSSYADTGRWIGFHHVSNGSSNSFDVNAYYIEECQGAASAKVTLNRWNQVRIDADTVPFYVEYYPQYGGASSHVIRRIDSVPYILSLNGETIYYFKFRCDSLADNCHAEQSVKTLAAPIEVPSCIDFDTAAVGSVLRGWTRRINGIVVDNSVSHTSGNSQKLPIDVNSYLITPDANIDSIQKVALSIWYQVEDLADRLVVGVMSDPNDLSTFYPVRTLAPVEAGEWQHGLVDFRNAPPEAHFIAFRARSNRQGGGRSVYVDDIYVSNCAAFDFSVQKLTNNSIDLTWNQVGAPNTTITVLDEGVVADTYTNVTPPLHIEPLTMLHYYTFIFNSDCGTEGYCSTNYVDTLSVVTPEPGVGCVNATDLASPQAVFFSGTYSNPYSHAGAINYGPLHPDSRHTVCYDTAQRDPRTGNLLRTIPEGYTSSVRLGNWSTNAYNPESEGVIYSLYVDTSSYELLLLRYAAVLQDPLHDPADQPRFRMELLDTNYNIIDSACTSADFIADQNLGWNTADDGVLWKDWTAVGVDLSSHAGEHVYFRLTTYDCNEGSHYGYAYFTLECMRKNMNTVSCGDVDSNTLSAPEGFHYRWYTSQSTATVSTAQKITVPSEDITYFCEVSKLDNPACNFTISAYGGTRYPIAAFDTAIVIDSCRFFVNFTNLSGVSRDGVTLIPGENCETAQWQYGNGTGSTNYHGYAVYNLPGTYTVRLVSGIAHDACQDTVTMTLVLELPVGMIPSDTTAASICDNQHYTFFSQSYNTPGEYHQFVSVPGQHCDSLYVLQLDVRATSSSDTVAVACDSITWRGQTYTTDGTYSSGPIGLNTVGCDTTVNLILTVHPTYDTVDPIIVCPYERYVYRGVDYGGPASIDTVLYSIYNCDSVVHVTLTPRDTTFRLAPYYYFDSLPALVPDTMLISCAPSTLYVIDSTLGVTQWSWMLFTPDTTVNGITSAFSYTFETGRDSVSAYLSLVTTSEGDCLDTIGWPVFVFPSPVADFRWLPERPSILHADVQFRNLTTPQQSEIDSLHSLTYLWRIQPTVGGEFDTTSVLEPHYQWGEQGDNMAGDYTVQLIASWTHPADSFYFEDMLPWVDPAFYHAMLWPTFTHTCIDTSDQTVTITNEYLQFPNLVSPNGDGVNDRWEVVNLVEMGDYPMNELWVYDRTGALVYHVKNIRRAEQFWDPNATRSPDGTYYYRFMAEGDYGVVKRNGTIEVLRK